MMQEEAIQFGDNLGLVGVLTLPDEIVSGPAVLFLNAGMIHHVGPSRIYVRLARRLVKLGIVTLRFDFSGIGDSCARTDNLSIEKAVVDDVRQAMDYLQAHLGISQFILTGHCSGAWASFVVASKDERVVGAILMNPESGQDDWVEYDHQRKVSRYYENYYAREALVDPERWKKLLTGKADYRSIFNNVVKSILRNKISSIIFRLRMKLDPETTASAQSEFQQTLIRVADTFVQRRVSLLLVFSNGSSSIEHAHTMIGKQLEDMHRAGIITEVTIPNADHTFTLLAGQQALMQEIEIWSRSTMMDSHPESVMG